MKRLHSYLSASSVLVAGAFAVAACSSKFSDCAASRSCAEPSGGSPGESEAGAPDQVDDSGGAGRTSHAAGAGGATDIAAAAGSGGEGGASFANDDAGASGALETAGSGATGGAAVPVDVVPPSILSITPVNGATQLTPATDVIVITFSEPMNRPSAEAAYAPSGDAPKPTFSWNAPGTELSINPNLTYPAATDPAAAATPFKFSVTTAAKDLAGNSLVANVNWQLTLLREVTQSFGIYGGSNWSVGLGPSSFVGAGDDKTDVATRGFMTFDITALPAGIMTFEGATISTFIAGINGDPFGQFGNMLIQSISFEHANQAAFDAPPLNDLLVFIAATGQNAANDAVTKDVLVALKDDYANRITRGNVSQYRLLFPSAPNSNGVKDFAYVSGSKNVTRLMVKYLFP